MSAEKGKFVEKERSVGVIPGLSNEIGKWMVWNQENLTTCLIEWSERDSGLKAIIMGHAIVRRKIHQNTCTLWNKRPNGILTHQRIYIFITVFLLGVNYEKRVGPDKLLLFKLSTEKIWQFKKDQ